MTKEFGLGESYLRYSVICLKDFYLQFDMTQIIVTMPTIIDNPISFVNISTLTRRFFAIRLG